MKTKKMELILLAAAIVALGLYLILRPGDQPGDRLPQPAAVDTDQINRIIVTRPEAAPLELVKKDARWIISPQGYPADTVTATNLAIAATDLTLTALVSESGNYERYGLTADEKTVVRAFHDGKVLRAFDLGKAAPTQQHTFVLIDGDPNVFHARGQIARTFEQTVESLRDRTVFDFDRTAVHSISLTRDGQTLSLVQQAVTADEADKDAENQGALDTPDWTEWQDARGRTVDQEAVTRLLDGMARLQCDSYLDDDAPSRLTDARWQITFESPEGNFTLMVFAQEEAADEASTADEADAADDKIPAMASTNDFAFALRATRVQAFEASIDTLFDARED